MPRTLRQHDTARGPIAYGAMCGGEYLTCPIGTEETPYHCKHCGQWTDSPSPCHACACQDCAQALAQAHAQIAASAERAVEAIVSELPESEQDRAIADLVQLGTKLYLRLYMADYSANDLELIKNWLNERE